MSYLVKDYMTPEVTTVDYKSKVITAAKIMAADRHLEGYVIVLKEGKPVGIITERDIVNKVVAAKLDPSKTKAFSIMSTPLVTVDPEEDLLKASQLMQEHNVKKLGVVKNSIIYGIITARNIAMQVRTYVDHSIRDIVRWTAPLGI